MLEIADLEHLVGLAEFDHLARRARRSDRRHFVERELPFRENVQNLAPDIAGGADDRDPIAHFTHSNFWDPKSWEPRPIASAHRKR